MWQGGKRSAHPHGTEADTPIRGSTNTGQRSTVTIPLERIDCVSVVTSLHGKPIGKRTYIPVFYTPYLFSSLRTHPRTAPLSVARRSKEPLWRQTRGEVGAVASLGQNPSSAVCLDIESSHPELVACTFAIHTCTGGLAMNLECEITFEPSQVRGSHIIESMGRYFKHF